MKKHLITIPLAILAALAIPGLAAAHNATATPSCSGLSWSVTNFNKDVTNTIVVKVDGATVHQDLDFMASDTGTHPWSQTAAHTWSVVVNAPGTEFDKSFAGTWQPCQTAPSTTVVATTTVSPTTSVPDVATTVVTDPTTTTVVAVGDPPVPTTALGVADPVLVPEPVLPRTGGAVDWWIATGLLLLGFGFMFVARRRVA